MTAAPLRVVVVDDEAPARALLCEYLALLPEVDVVAACANGFEAIKKIAEAAPDVVLLDVQMPKLNGFEVVELLPDPRPAIIFVTAYESYALRAFEVHAQDYVLKPIDPDRLADALRHVRDARSSGGVAARRDEVPVAALRRAARPGEYLDRVLIREAGHIRIIRVETIDYIEAQGDYVVFAVGPEKVRKQQTLRALAEALDPKRFVRIHRSTVLPLDRLENLELYAKDSRVAVLRDGTRLPVSRAGYARLRKLL